MIAADFPFVEETATTNKGKTDNSELENKNVCVMSMMLIVVDSHVQRIVLAAINNN